MISNKCYYALRAMLELAKKEGSGPVTIGHIAKAQHIPVRFLESILRQLKQGNFTDSVRGKDGGYCLAKNASEITVNDVIELIEGPLVAVNPAVQTKVARERIDVFDDVWQTAEETLAASLNKISFDELAEHEKDIERKLAANYSI